ncbi:MAG TPA: hypothetical protein VJT31_12840 [Rugosimonospora sp.]|nr:hypothetical protein [Rugosimonospora sp.]
MDISRRQTSTVWCSLRVYRRLLSLLAVDPVGLRAQAINGLLSTELDQRAAAFEEALRALDDQILRWSPNVPFVALDSTVYVRHPNKLEEIDFNELVGAHGTAVHILVPILVVEELDPLKQHNKAQVRWRAGYTWAFQDLALRPSLVDREKCLQAGRISGVYAKMIPYRKALFACMTLPDGPGG